MTVWLMIIISEQNRLTDSECSINQSIMGRRLTTTLIQEGWMFLILTHLHIIYLDHTKCQMWRFSNLTFLNLKHTRSPRGGYKFKKAPRGVRTPFFFLNNKKKHRKQELWDVVRFASGNSQQQTTAPNYMTITITFISNLRLQTDGESVIQWPHQIVLTTLNEYTKLLITNRKKKLNVCDIETDVDEKCSQ